MTYAVKRLYSPKLESPTEIRDFGFCSDGDNVYIFGGYGKTRYGDSATQFNELWQFKCMYYYDI